MLPIHSKSIKKNGKQKMFLTVFHFFISQHFLNAKTLVKQAVIAKYISRKMLFGFVMAYRPSKHFFSNVGT